MKVAFRGTAVPGEHEGASSVAVDLFRERHTVRQSELGPQVADHAHNLVLGASKVKAAVPALGEPMVLALELREETVERDVARGEDAQVAVHREDELVLGHGGCDAHRDGLLAHAAEPLADFALTQLGHHFLLNHAWQQQLAVQRDLIVRAEASSLKA